MSRLFISHSGKNDDWAIALKDWLDREGWSGPDDIFLDLDPERGIAAGQRWAHALEDAATRCEAVLFLVSQDWLNSKWCGDEYQLANRLNKKLFALLIDDVALDRLPGGLTAQWQVVSLKGEPAQRFLTVHPLTRRQSPVHIAEAGLASLKRGLEKAGIGAETFELQPDQNGPFGWRAPYRGLEALEPEDAAVFYGRNADIVRGIDALRGLAARKLPRLMVILGASGAGKSSFLRAGLWPRLLRDDSQWLPLRAIRAGRGGAIEGSEGLLASLEDVHRRFALQATRADLRERLATPQSFVELLGELRQAAAKRALISKPPFPLPVICLDQGEEVFVSGSIPEIQRLLQMVRVAIDQDAALLLNSIRSDSYGVMQGAKILAGIEQVPLSLGPVPHGEIGRIIREPAELLHRKAGPAAPVFDAAIIERLQQEIDGEDDALPLLAFVLQRLMREHQGITTIGLAELDRTGGVAAAIESAAESALDDAGIGRDRAEQREALRRLFIPRLARIDRESKVPQRRVARQNELPPELLPLANALTRRRLLVVKAAAHLEKAVVADGATLEVAHEALLRRWPTLAALLSEDRDALLLLDGVLSAAADWSKADADRKVDFLAHRGSRLSEAEALASHGPDWDREIMPALAYLAACRARESPAFRQAGVDLLPLGLERAGLGTRSFPWPPAGDSDRAPYRGLLPLLAEDAAIFFGRDRDVLRALERTRSLIEAGPRTLLIILGARGAGKSSFLTAGLLSRLARYDNDFLQLPTVYSGSRFFGLASAISETFGRFGISRDPVQIQTALLGGSSALDQVLDGISKGAQRNIGSFRDPTIVLPIDQLESLFLSGSPDAPSFLDLITEILAPPNSVRHRILVIATLSSNNYELFEADGRFTGAKVELFTPSRMQEPELYEVITGPAARSSATFEPADLPLKIAHEASILESADLPLLAFYLHVMWRQTRERADRTLRAPTTQPIQSWVSNILEGAFDQIPDDEHRGIARRMFQALTELKVDNQIVRRPLRFGALTDTVGGSELDVIRVFDLFRGPAGQSFLLPDQSIRLESSTVVDITHESLVRGWPRLQNWAEEEAESAKVYRRLAETAGLFAMGQAGLWLDQDLEIALAWRQRTQPNAAWAARYHGNFSEAMTFLERSQRRKMRARRAMRGAIAGAIASLFVMAVGAVFLAQQAFLARDTAEAALRSATVANLRTSSVISPDGTRMLVLKPHGQISVVDLVSNQQIGKISIADAEVTSAAFSPDGARIVTSESTGVLAIWDTATFQLLRILSGATAATRRVVFSPDGSLIASGGDDSVARVWSGLTGELKRDIQVSAPVIALAFSPDGKSLIVSTANGTIYVIDPGTGASHSIGG